MKLTHERLKSLLNYDPSTGGFTWAVDRGRMRAGSIAGSLGSHGYWEIRVDGTLYLAHRLAWLYLNGDWPIAQIDHKNLSRTLNTPENIRSASVVENNINHGLRSDNKSGFKGAYWIPRLLKWGSTICINGKRQHLGLHETPEQAHEAYCNAGRAAFGQFFNAGHG